MNRAIRIRAGEVELRAELRDSPTGGALWDALPLSSRAARWGDEFYFTVPSLLVELEPDAREVLEIGEIGYWVQGEAVAIFFGPTPASREGEPRAVVPVNVVGHITDDPRALASLHDGQVFHLERVE